MSLYLARAERMVIGADLTRASLLLGASALGAEFRGARHGLAAVDAKFCCGLGSTWS